MLNMMMPNYTVFMLDEPEAFLHPPQARVLGENLPSLLGERQSFISTHSIELIKGLLIAAEHRVRIIRITRNGALNPVHYLTPANLKEIWKDLLCATPMFWMDCSINIRYYVKAILTASCMRQYMARSKNVKIPIVIPCLHCVMERAE